MGTLVGCFPVEVFLEVQGAIVELKELYLTNIPIEHSISVVRATRLEELRSDKAFVALAEVEDLRFGISAELMVESQDIRFVVRAAPVSHYRIVSLEDLARIEVLS